jgi:hypothetical protein
MPTARNIARDGARRNPSVTSWLWILRERIFSVIRFKLLRATRDRVLVVLEQRSQGRHRGADVGRVGAAGTVPLVHAVPGDLVRGAGPGWQEVSMEVLDAVADCRHIDPLGPGALERRRASGDRGPDGFGLFPYQAGEVRAVPPRVDEQVAEVRGARLCGV